MNYQNYITQNIHISNKKIIVTGGTSGLGLATLKVLVSLGNDVVIAARNIEKIKKTIQVLSEINPNVKIDYILYNQDELESVRNLSKKILEEHIDFDIIFLNAGVYLPKIKITKDGYPYTIEVNYFSNFLLLNELKDVLKNNHKKVVFQGSLTSRAGLGKYNLLDNLSLNKQYGLSKLALYNLFLYYSNLKYKTDFVYVEPGISNTSIYRSMPGLIVKAANVFIRFTMNNTKVAILNALYAMNNSVVNGDVYIPRGFKRFKGYPKKFTINEKFKEVKYINQAKEILNIHE